MARLAASIVASAAILSATFMSWQGVAGAGWVWFLAVFLAIVAASD